MADTDRPSIKLDNVTPKVDEPVSINNVERRNLLLDQANDFGVSGIDIGKYSKYLNKLGGVYPTSPNDINELRAANQGVGEKWLNGSVKFFGKVGTSFMEPYVDLAYGVPSAIADGKFSSVFDNEVTQTFDKFNDYLQENFPNYYTERETNAPTFNPKNWFTANFWADKVLGGAAFTVGTLLNAYATMGIMTGAKGIGLGLKAGNTGAKAALASASQLGKASASHIDDLIRLGNVYRFKNGAEALSASLFSVVGEAGLEARGLGKELRKELQPLVDQGKISQEEMNSRVEQAMGIAFASNVAIVGTSQFIQFGKLFQRGYRPNKLRLNRIVKEDGKFIQKLPTTGFGKFAYKTTGARIAVRDILTEAKEEGLQFLTQKSLESRYGEEVMKDMSVSLTEGMKELFGTKEGQENMLIGAILGGGSHVGKLIGSQNKQTYNQIRESATGKVVDILNKQFTKEDNILEKLVANAGTQIAATERKEYYLSKEDIFNYKNEEAKEFASVVKSFMDLGALDILKEQIDAFGNMKEEDFQAMINPNEESSIAKSKSEYITEIKKKITEYSNIHSAIENRYSDRLPQYRSNLFHATAVVNDLMNRELQIKNNIKDTTGIDYADFSSLRSKQYYERAKDKIKKQAGKGEQKAEEKIPTDRKEIFDTAFTDAINEWLADHSNELNEEQVEEISNQISDLANIHDLRQRYVDQIAFLNSPEGLKNTSTEEIKKEGEQAEKDLLKKAKENRDEVIQKNKEGKLKKEELDKAVSDMLNLNKITGRKEFKKYADELANLMKEDEVLKEESSDSKSSSPKGNQTKKTKGKKGSKETAPAKSNKKKRGITKDTKVTRTIEDSENKAQSEADQVELSPEQEEAISNAFDAIFEQANEKDDTISEEEAHNSVKRTPVEEENQEEDSGTKTYKALLPLFTKNGEFSLWKSLGAENMKDFPYVMKFLNQKAIDQGRTINESMFNILKGFYLSFVLPTEAIGTPIRKSYDNYTYEMLKNSEFHIENKEVVTIAKVNEVKKAKEKPSNRGEARTENKKSFPGLHSALAILNRAFKRRNNNVYLDIDNKIFNSNNLNYDEINVGTPVILRVAEETTWMEDGSEPDGVKILKKYQSGETLTFDEIKRLPIEMVTEDGKKLGHLHSEKKVRERIKGKQNEEQLAIQLDKLSKLRALAYAKGPITTKINVRKNGSLIKHVSTNEGSEGKPVAITATVAFEDPKIKFAVGDNPHSTDLHLRDLEGKSLKGGTLRTSPKQFANEIGEISIKDEKIVSGVVYALIPVNKNESGETVYIPAPMQSMRPSDFKPSDSIESPSDTTTDLYEFAEAAVKSVRAAIEIHLIRGNLNTEQKRLKRQLKERGFDIESSKDLRKYINNFFYTFDKITDMADDISIGNDLRAYLRSTETGIGNAILNISPFYVGYATTGQSEMKVARLYKDGNLKAYNMPLENETVDKQDEVDIDVFLDGLEANLRQQFFKVNLNNLNSTRTYNVYLIKDGNVETETYEEGYNEYAKKLLRSDVMGVYDEANERFVYSIHPKIETDTAFLEDEKTSKEIDQLIKDLNDGKLDDEISKIHKQKGIGEVLTNIEDVDNIEETEDGIEVTKGKKKVKIKTSGKSKKEIQEEVDNKLKSKKKKVDKEVEAKKAKLREELGNTIDISEIEEDEHDSIRRENPDSSNSETERIETKVGVRKDGRLKTYLAKNYKSTLKKVQEVNKYLRESHPNMKAKIVKVRGEVGDFNEYYGIIIYKTSAENNNVFNSFKRTREKHKKTSFGKDLTGEIYIANLNEKVQSSAINNMASIVFDNLRRLNTEDNVKNAKAISQSLERVRDGVKSKLNKVREYIELEDDANIISKYKIIEARLEGILDNFTPLANMAMRKLSASNIIDAREFRIKETKAEFIEQESKSTEEIVDREVDEDAVDQVDDLEDNSEDTTHFDTEGSIRKDTKKTVSKELKFFLSDIRYYGKDGKPLKDFLDIRDEENNTLGRDLVPYDYVFNVISRILAGKHYYGKNAFNQMIQELEAHVKNYPFLQDVITKLRIEKNNGKSKIPYQFQRAMLKHKVEMLYVGFSYRKTGKDGRKRFYIYPIDTNSAYNSKVITNNWFANFKINSFKLPTGKMFTPVSIDEEIGDDVLTDKNYKTLYSIARNKKSPAVMNAYKAYITAIENKENIEDARRSLSNNIHDALSVIGVSLEQETVDDIIDGNILVNNKNIGVESMFNNSDNSNKAGLYLNFVKSFKNRTNQPLSITNLFKHDFANILAEAEAKYNTMFTANSFKDQVGKSTYSYSNSKYNAERAIKLLKNPLVDTKQKTKLRDQLKEIPFVKNSTWLEMLENGRLTENNFAIKYADAVVNFTSDTPGKKVKDASPADIEIFKLGLLMNRGSGGATFLYPTLSDGHTIMTVDAIAEDITLTDDNKVAPMTIDLMYHSLVEPEIDRIRDFQKKGKTGFKGYDKGANMFLFLPKLNDSKYNLFDENGKLKEIGEEERQTINEVIEEYADNLIENKLNEWYSFGILRDSNAVTSSAPLLYEKSDLQSEEEIDNHSTWDIRAMVIRNRSQISKAVYQNENYGLEDVVYVYETDDDGSLLSESGKAAQKMFDVKENKIGFNNRTYGLVTAPSQASENRIKDKNDIVKEFKKLADTARENPDKLFILNLETVSNVSSNFSKYNIFNIADMLAVSNLPNNVSIKSNLNDRIKDQTHGYTTKKGVKKDGLKDITLEEQKAKHEKAKRYSYKNRSLYFVDEKFYDSKFEKDDSSTLNRPYFTAAYYVINYMIANANMHQLFIGDPALYYKGSKKEDATYMDNVKETFDNVSKRLAGDRAPGEFIGDSFDPEEKYTQLIVADRELASEAQEFMMSLGYNYEGIESTDAQEFTTLKEDLYIRMKAGMISYSLYNSLYGKKGIVTKELDKGNYDYYGAIEKGLKAKDQDLYDEFKELVNQPMKPVYVNNITEEVNGQKIDRRVYIKSSAFALNPAMTKNRQLDKLRIHMEKNGVDRVAFGTAVKVGDYTETENVTIYNDEGNMELNEEQLLNNTIELPRDGFRIQQELPYREDKVHVKFGVQESALLFNNLLDDIIADGKKGSDIKEDYDQAYGQLYRQALESVYDELGIPIDDISENGFNRNNLLKIDQKKLSKLLYNEALNRGYSPNELQALELTNGEFNLRLAFHSRGLQLESVLNSIVNNRVIKHKFFGKGFVLGTQEGFKYLKDKNLRDRVIWNINTKDELSARKLTDELKPMGFVDQNGEYVDIKDADKEGVKFQPAQVLVPSILTDSNTGRKIDLFEKDKHDKWKYLIKLNNRLVLNHTAIDPEVLKMFGFRIPTQGHNSMSYIEIAGFLPKEAGDLIIAPRDFVKQMGSDFDVDKLYTYMYNVEVRGNRIQKVNSKGDTKESLQNRILDHHFTVLSSTNPNVQKQIFEPLAFGLLKSDKGEFESESKEVTKKVNEEFDGNFADYIFDLNDISDREFTGLSDMYQRDTFLEGRDGNIGIGAFSLNSVLNANIQNAKMTIGQTLPNKEGDSEFIEDDVYFGKTKSNSAFESRTVKDDYYKSQVISWYQSASVDNAKEKILFKLNINPTTFPVIAYLNQLGFTEEVMWFINQPIIRDYVQELQNSHSSLALGDENVDRAMEAINKKYKAKVVGNIAKGFKDGKSFGIDNMQTLLETHKDGRIYKMNNEAIKKDKDASNYYKAQLGALFIFKEFLERGNRLQKIQSVTNSNSKGVGATISETHIKAKEIVDLADTSFFQNREKIIGTYLTEEEYKVLPEKDKEKFILVGDRTYIRPETIQGFASIYGTVAASRIFSSILPHNSEYISSAFDMIDEVTGYKAQAISTRAKHVNQIWNELKKFINSKALEDNVDTEVKKKELLLDFTDPITGRVNDSLATKISKIKYAKTLKGNLFFEGLEIKTDKTGQKFPTINYNHNTSDNIDESIVYQSFAELIINSSDPILPDSSYTKGELADDLIKYSLIVGGIQQFGKFVKYVPFKYLQAIGYADTINSLDFDSPDVVGFKRTTDTDNIPEFVTQYFQHHPNEAPVIGQRNKSIVSGVSDNVGTVRQIQLDKGVKNNKVMRGNELVPFVSMFNYDTNKYQLYKLTDTELGIYTRISTLGSNGISEYSYNGQFSNVYQNTVLETEETNFIISKDGTIDNTFSDRSSSIQNLISDYSIDSGNPSNILYKIVDNISKRDDIDSKQSEFNSFMAEKLVTLADSFDVEIRLDNTLPVEARYIAKGENESDIILLNLDYITDTIDPNSTFERVFLHEYIHAITRRIIKSDQNNLHVSSIQGIIDRIKDDFKKLGTDIDAILDKAGETGKIDKEDEQFYGLLDVDEFITEFFTNAKFRDFLSGLKLDGDPKHKNVLEKIYEVVIDLLNSFGLDIDKNSIAGEGFMHAAAILDYSFDGEFIQGLASFRKPVKKKSKRDTSPIEIKKDSKDKIANAFNKATNSFKSEEEKDSVMRKMVNEGRLEIVCKL